MPRHELLRRIRHELVDLRKLPNDDPRWSKIHSGKMPKLAWCYAMGGHEFYRMPPWEREVARVYAHGLTTPKAILLDKAAALLLGIPVVTPGKTFRATLPSNSTVSTKTRHFFSYVRANLAGEVLELEGVKVSSPARTALDIARFHGFVEGLTAVDHVRAHGVGKERLDGVLGAMGRVKGVGHARGALRSSVRDSDSLWESYARGLLIEANIPGVHSIVTQQVIGHYRADIAINGWLLIEVDGNVKYRKEVDEVIRQEHKRQKALLNQGFIVLRYSPEELLRNPQRFVDDVRKHIAAGRRTLPS